jgi:CRP-like cAMP-binding protein
MFADLSDDDCDAVLRVLKGRRGAPGQTLFSEGDPGDTLMIVVDGQLEATVTAPDGSQARLSTIPAGHVVGELAFLDAAPRSATVTTPTGATVLEFSRQALLVLCRDNPRIGATIQRNVLADLAKRVRAVEGTLGHVRTAPQRLSGQMKAVSGSNRPRGKPVTVPQLRAIPVLASHSNEDLELLAYATTLRGFSRGDVLMHEGASGESAFLVLRGQVVVTRNGERAPLAILEDGALVGQLALLDRAPRSATVTAAADTTALEIAASVFTHLVGAHTPLALRFQREIATAAARHLRQANQRFANKAANDARMPAFHEIKGDWAQGGDEPIELGVDLDAIRR